MRGRRTDTPVATADVAEPEPRKHIDQWEARELLNGDVVSEWHFVSNLFGGPGEWSRRWAVVFEAVAPDAIVLTEPDGSKRMVNHKAIERLVSL